ncbi:hypothetical protein WMY93_024493 [Mugilogobius chulae]|uniref:Selectin P n=1 Tax=Mugilogobius chulae TaxID=88201 RepID=A0AAW0N1F8_9GOBI
MNWTNARKWCQATFTDMVVIQNQHENDFLVSLLPQRNSSPYFWIGITKTYTNEPWRWIGNNSTWIGNKSWAENEPNNNRSTEFCVEIYTSMGRNRGKWNDEKCNVLKYASCFKAQCTNTTCDRGRCLETINNATCLCEVGFVGDRCQTAVACLRYTQGYLALPDHTLGPDWNTVHFDTQFDILHLTCSIKYNLSTGYFCTLPTADVDCALVPDADEFSCSSKNHTLNSTCHVTCSFGFLTIVSANITCQTNGLWTGPRPACANSLMKKQTSPVLLPE